MRRAIGVLVAWVLLWGTSGAHAENWPGFRGPTGQGISSETNLPVQWSASEAIAWRQEIPGEGWSSPIVFGNRVFVTTATDGGTSCRVVCLDRDRGKILWNTEVFKQEVKRKEGKNSYATPTPVTDGKHVFAVFGGGGIAAVDYDGQIAWTNEEIRFYSQHGLGASPRLVGELLIMPFDGSSEGDNKDVGWKRPWNKAVLLAVDKNTGQVAWRGERGMSRIAHVTPIVVGEEDALQVISPAGDVVQGFDPKSGDRLWTVYSQGEGVVPSAVLGDGVVFTASGFEKPTIRAVRLGGHGDVTSSHIVWEQTVGVPTQASLLYVSPYLYSITDNGVAHCFHAESGEVVWKDRVGGKFSASPVYADGKIYFLSEAGETTIIEAGPEFKVLAKNSINEHCQASMAVSDGRLFIRSASHLCCIGSQPADR